jgi:SAM-dependent methyltransferase
LKNTLKKIAFFRLLYGLNIAQKQFFRFDIIGFVRRFTDFLHDYITLKNQPNNPHFRLHYGSLLPALTDKTSTTPTDPIYFYQDAWAASKIFALRPTHHYDVGSAAKTIGILSQFVPITMIDIRPLELVLPRLHFMEGSIVNLPIPTNSVQSISSLCVVEHIGLGRYGDPIDSYGSEKAITELKRVCAIGGHLLFSVPVDATGTVYFNAHRAFTPEYIKEQFQNFELLDEQYIYGKILQSQYQPDKGYGVGLYYWCKKSD